MTLQYLAASNVVLPLPPYRPVEKGYLLLPAGFAGGLENDGNIVKPRVVHQPHKHLNPQGLSHPAIFRRANNTAEIHLYFPVIE